jgi:IS30 family transposase
VSREVARYGGRPAYRASQADGEAWQSALRPKRCLLSTNLKLRDIVASKLMLDWSPKQINSNSTAVFVQTETDVWAFGASPSKVRPGYERSESIFSTN